jgi:hypothetical protein
MRRDCVGAVRRFLNRMSRLRQEVIEVFLDVNAAVTLKELNHLHDIAISNKYHYALLIANVTLTGHWIWKRPIKSDS